MSIFANRKSKPEASFLSHARNIFQRVTLFSIHANFHELFGQLRVTLFSIHANFHELFDQLKQVLQCIFVIGVFVKNNLIKKLQNSRFYWKIFFNVGNSLDYKWGMIIFQDVLQIINNCEKICRKAKQDETSSILIFASCFMGPSEPSLQRDQPSPPPGFGKDYKQNVFVQKAKNY